MNDIDRSIDRVIAGVEKRSKVLTDADKELTSYHEVGHALIDKLLPDANEGINYSARNGSWCNLDKTKRRIRTRK